MGGFLEDTYRTRGLRQQLVNDLRQKGISSEAVLGAIGRIPRHYFIDSAFLEHAYQDKAFAIGEGQTISQPSTVAFQTELLDLVPEQRILEIGTGSGYQSAVLLEMGAWLFSIEFIEKLHLKAKFDLRRMGYHKGTFLHGDGSMGWPAHAPYDAILVTAGAPTVPSALVAQLKIGGRLVIPVGMADEQRMLRLTRISEKQIKQEDFGPCAFVPLVGKDGWRR